MAVRNADAEERTQAGRSILDNGGVPVGLGLRHVFCVEPCKVHRMHMRRVRCTSWLSFAGRSLTGVGMNVGGGSTVEPHINCVRTLETVILQLVRSLDTIPSYFGAHNPTQEKFSTCFLEVLLSGKEEHETKMFCCIRWRSLRRRTTRRLCVAVIRSEKRIDCFPWLRETAHVAARRNA